MDFDYVEVASYTEKKVALGCRVNRVLMVHSCRRDILVWGSLPNDNLRCGCDGSEIKIISSGAKALVKNSAPASITR